MIEDLSFKPDELPEDRSLVLVDDDKAFALRLARAMEMRGFEVRTAHTVAEGMMLIRQSAPPSGRLGHRFSNFPRARCGSSRGPGHVDP